MNCCDFPRSNILFLTSNKQIDIPINETVNILNKNQEITLIGNCINFYLEKNNDLIISLNHGLYSLTIGGILFQDYGVTFFNFFIGGNNININPSTPWKINTFDDENNLNIEFLICVKCDNTCISILSNITIDPDQNPKNGYIKSMFVKLFKLP